MNRTRLLPLFGLAPAPFVAACSDQADDPANDRVAEAEPTPTANPPEAEGLAPTPDVDVAELSPDDSGVYQDMTLVQVEALVDFSFYVPTELPKAVDENPFITVESSPGTAVGEPD